MKYNPILLIIFLLLQMGLPEHLQAQETPIIHPLDTSKQIPFVAYWNKGETHKYKLLEISTHERNGKVLKQDTSHAEIYLTVIDSTSDSYTVEWAYRVLSIRQKKLQPDPDPQKSPTKYLIQTDELGTFVELSNWEEINQKNEKLAEGLNQYLQDKNKDKKNKTQPVTIKDVRAQLEDGELNPELLLFHQYLGLELPVDTVITYADQLSNGYGGFDVLAANTTFLLNRFPKEGGICEIREETKVDQELLKSDLLELMLKGKKRKDRKPIIASVEALDIDITRYNQYVFNYYFGWPVYVENMVVTKGSSIYKGEKVLEYRMESLSMEFIE